MPFIANTDAQRAEMLKTLELNSIEDLFADIPKELKVDSLNIPRGLSESEVFDRIHDISHRNAHDLTCFLGGGFYDHFIPSAVDALASRSEFYTAYTPYQPEASQGTLQTIFEYQSTICRLTGMEVSNASLYEGGTALYEAAMMAVRLTGRKKIILDSGVNPIYRKMMHCYTSNLSLNLVELEIVHGQSDREKFLDTIDESVAAVVLQNPNFFGAVDDFSDISELCHQKGALSIMSVYPISLGILKSPAAMGADIVTGEGQSLGIPLSFGGPYLGFMATSLKLARKMPGRIVGETVDAKGRTGYVLTLQAREQHIRREKATSNICSNEALCAARAVFYTSLLGKHGLRDLALLCAQKAEYAKTRFSAIPGVEVKNSTPTFNEFTVELPRDASEVVSRLIDKGFAPGLPLGRYYRNMDNYLLVAVTEKRTREDIGLLAESLESVL